MASSGALAEVSGSPQPACSRKRAARPNVSESCFDMADLLERRLGWLLLDDIREHDPRQVAESPGQGRKALRCPPVRVAMCIGTFTRALTPVHRWGGPRRHPSGSTT